MAARLLRFDRLLLLVEAADRGSISAVARARGCTPSAISQQLSALEREAGVDLLDRSNAGVALTAAAQRLVERVRRAAAEVEAGEQELREVLTPGQVTGSLHIAAVASAAATLVSEAVGALEERWQGIACRVTDMEPAASLRAVKLADVDLAIVDEYEHIPPEPVADVRTYRLLTEPLVFVLPPGTAAVPGPLRLEDFSGHRWVAAPREAACGDAVRRACHAAGFAPDVRWITDDLDLSVRHVAAGHGVALLPLLVALQAVRPVEVRAVAGQGLVRHLVVASREGGTPSPVRRAMFEALRTAAGVLEVEIDLADPR